MTKHSIRENNEFIKSPVGSRTFFLPIETIIDGLND